MTTIEPLEALARNLVGDGQAPNVYFVTDEGVVVTVTTSREVADREWEGLRDRYPRRESALEDRLFGTLASVEPEEDDSDILLVMDNRRLVAEMAKVAGGWS